MKVQARVQIPQPPSPGDNWRAPLYGAAALLIGTLGIGGAWAVNARLDGAVLAPGVVAVESRRQTVQHFEGGIISEILVRDGDVVEEGQILFRVENNVARANAETLMLQLAALLLKEARLVAERDNLPAIIFPPEVTTTAGNELVSRAIVDEQAQFNQRRDALRFQVKVLETRIEQLEREIKGLSTEEESHREQLSLVVRELPGLRSLLARQLVPLARVSAQERERVRLEGLIARNEVDVTKARGQIGEARLQIEQAQIAFNQSVATDLVEARRLIGDTRGRITAAQDTMQRLDVRAPMAGVAQSRRFATRGAVVRPGDPLVEIAPLDQNLIVQAQVSPNDVDVLRTGMKAQLRFPNFKLAEAPVIYGAVRTISNDRVIDGNTPPYFAVEILADTSTIAPAVRARIRPGQNAEVIITTGERSAISYLVQPLTERIAAAMRER